MKRFGVVPAAIPIIRTLEEIAPIFRQRVEAVMNGLTDAGHDAIIAESLRSDERQRYLFGFGRDYDDGRGIVTHSSVGHASWHFYGLAVDVISLADLWNAPEIFWSTLGTLAEEQGLAWGGAWPNFPDKPHIQFGHPMHSSPTSETVATYRSGGVQAVWKGLGVG